jgi:putative FmdB family regulatory protein
MPIYAYKCESCGHAKDFLQKMSDPPLTDCPACGKPALAKQVTAAGFQLKGSGWYVTDFRGGNTGAAKEGGETKADAKPETKTDAPSGDSAKPSDTSSAPAPSAPAAASTPASTSSTPSTPSTPASSS